MNEHSNTFPVLGGVLVLALIVAGYLYFSHTTPAPMAQNSTGKAYVTVSDASVNMQNISDVTMTVDKVELHSAAQGWVTVSTMPQTFNLLTLKASGKAMLAGSADVAADTYDQVRATVSSVSITTKNAGTKAAVLASSTLTLPGTIVVRANESSHADLDVQTSSSLRLATKGEFVFVPVVIFKSSHSTNVVVANDNSVTSSGGTVDTDATIGTDLSGTASVGAELSPSLQIQIVGGALVVASTSATSAQLIQIGGSASPSSSVQSSAGGGINIGY